MSAYAYLILSFARPEKLMSCIRSIKIHDPTIPIFLCVDICDDVHSPFYKANQELIALGKNLVQLGEIAAFTYTPSNLRTPPFSVLNVGPLINVPFGADVLKLNQPVPPIG